MTFRLKQKDKIDIFQLITEVNNGRPSLLSVFNIYIIPLLNPDGYEYAQTEVIKYHFFV